MTQLVFATNNPHKVQEINQILKNNSIVNANGVGQERGMSVDKFNIVTMSAIGHTTDLPETHETIIENAIEKAQFLHKMYNIACFSEDTGLEIDALNSKPGVHTAHYSGSRDPRSNIDLVLKQMGETPYRSARFRTIICLILNNEQYIFEGICEGKIRFEPSGTEGFGYDPIFQPDGFDETFATLSADKKNSISHRGKAMQQLLNFLKK